HKGEPSHAKPKGRTASMVGRKNKRGRPRKQGARHPSGQLIDARDEPAGDPRAINCYQRIIKLGIGQGMENPLGRYLAERRISDAAWQGGDMVRRAWARWHRLNGLRPSPRGLAFDEASGPPPPYRSCHGAQGCEQCTKYARARKAWERTEARLLPSPAAAKIYELCVPERAIAWHALPAVNTALEAIARGEGASRPRRQGHA